MQLHRHGEAIAYLHERGVRTPELIEHMQIGYAPGGGCLRRWLTQLGYRSLLCQAGLVTAVGYDAYTHRIVFPLEATSMAAVSRLRRRLTAFCQVPRAACMAGSRSGNTPT